MYRVYYMNLMPVAMYESAFCIAMQHFPMIANSNGV
ncbi:hypothetical protein APH_0806 [Anaplasma phagocytophilum str. HZ]|uniref:Uncharacterized protein n=1 Tax=Anaplasma phagocytophilum (strain HZ) TaxID=212042 RepID=Q2GJR8_ANAPZ|nr:hypothetical protein APH_0806 [Anaplasma phagocytophilum str. HZ]